MKYSLRSLMKFTIRDLFLATMLVALVLGWWVDAMRRNAVGNAWRQRAAIVERYLLQEGWEVWWGKDSVGLQEPDDAGYQFSVLDDYPPSALISDDTAAKNVMPNSSAPAPNPPKP